MKSHIYFPLSFIKIKGTKLFKEIAALGRICENGFISRETQTLLTTSPYCSSVLEQPGPTMAVFEWYIRYMCMHVLPNLGKTEHQNWSVMFRRLVVPRVDLTLFVQ